VQLTQHRRDVIASTGPSDQTCGGVLDRRRVAVVETVQMKAWTAVLAAAAVIDRIVAQ